MVRSLVRWSRWAATPWSWPRSASSCRSASASRPTPDAGRRTVAVLARVAGLAAGLSVAVEVLQYVLGLGRVSSVDDVLVNTAGAVLAALCSRRWWA